MGRHVAFNQNKNFFSLSLPSRHSDAAFSVVCCASVPRHRLVHTRAKIRFVFSPPFIISFRFVIISLSPYFHFLVRFFLLIFIHISLFWTTTPSTTTPATTCIHQPRQVIASFSLVIRSGVSQCVTVVPVCLISSLRLVRFFSSRLSSTSIYVRSFVARSQKWAEKNIERKNAERT